MEILIGIVLFCGLLYWWLKGHWFACILMSVVLFGAGILTGAPGRSPLPFMILGAGLAFVPMSWGMRRKRQFPLLRL